MRRDRTLSLIAAALALVVVAPGVAAQPSPSASVPAPSDGSVLAELRTIEIPGTRIVSLSPDGRWVAAARPVAGTHTSLCVFALDTLEQRACSDPSEETTGIRLESVRWSPDGSRLAFTEEIARTFSDGDLWLMDAASGKLTNLDDDGFSGSLLRAGGAPPGTTVTLPLSAAFSSDGRRIAYSRSLLIDGESAGDEIAIVPVAGGPPERLARVSEGSEVFVASGEVGWAPDDATVYYSVARTAAGTGDGVWAASTATGATRLVARTMSKDGGPLTLLAVAPHGDRLLASDPERYARTFRGPAVALVDAVTGSVEPLESPVGDPAKAVVMPATFSPDGSTLLLLSRVVEPEFQLHLLDLETGDVMPLVPSGLPIVPPFDVPTWATDGVILIRAMAGEREGSGDTKALGTAVIIRLATAPTPGGSEPSVPSPAVSPLGSALAMMPATADTLGSVRSYVDYRAVEAARPGAAHPSSFTQLRALQDAEDASARLWTAAIMGIDSGSLDLLRQLPAYGAEWPARIGLDFFEIDRELAFGTRPADGLVLLGRFEPDRVAEAFKALGYTTNPADGRVLLCGPKGCEAGLDAETDQIDPQNPFGGGLGRLEPLTVSATDILNSASIETLQAMLAASADRAGSLASVPADRGAAEALETVDPVIQATFVPPSLLDTGLVAALQVGGDAAKRIIEEIAPAFEPVPPYELLAFADSATSTDQVVTIALVYGRAEDAQRAAEVLPKRIDGLPSLVLNRPLRALFDDRGITSVRGTVVSAADATPVALLTLRAPLAPSEPGPDGRMVSSSLVYRMLVDMVERRDTLWLAPSLPVLS